MDGWPLRGPPSSPKEYCDGGAEKSGVAGAGRISGRITPGSLTDRLVGWSPTACAASLIRRARRRRQLEICLAKKKLI
jgi:hypothetical protein